MAGKIKGFLNSPQGRDSLLTYLTEALSMLGMILTYRLAAQVSKQDLDLYVIVRRTVSFVFPVLIMGAMVGLTRFVAMSREPAQQRGYLRGALTWVLPLGALTMFLAVVFAKPLAWVIFGSEASAGLVPPLGLMIVGISLHGVAYGFLRGKKSMVAANAVQLFVLAVGPCAAFVLWDDMRTVLWATGIAWVGVPMLSLVPALVAPRKRKMRRERSELLRYGLPRVPGDIALGALLTVPGYVALRTHGLDVSGEVGFGATLLNLAAAAFSPVALLLLPAAAGRLAAGDHAGLEKSIARMTWMILAASVALTVGFELLAEPLLLIYLGPSGASYLPMARIIFIGALPFAFFNGMRSVLDAYFHTPRNGMNLMAAFGLLLVGSVIHLAVPTPWYTMGVVLVISMCWLGWATWRDVRYVRSELRRLAVRGPGQLRLVVLIPDRADGSTFAASEAQARSLALSGCEVSLFHLESRTSITKLWKARRKFKKLLREQRPDAVHVHFGSVAALFGVLTSTVPVIVTFMGDDLNRKGLAGLARPWMGGLFSQLSAFFAAGIICSDESVREHLWWRQSEALVLPFGEDGKANTGETLAYLREVALHKGANELAEG
ncbi:MAG: glycosyltransferase [Flavobacteriales bacterium]|jgi:Na+-driven multidrug efflux pump|nr:glycosyltransferase [Flavobacteriales bacterium]MCB0757907.1 glycosyltransferase [Flavobacteriales bacterium]